MPVRMTRDISQEGNLSCIDSSLKRGFRVPTTASTCTMLYYRLPVIMTGIPGLLKHTMFSTDTQIFRLGQGWETWGTLATNHLEVIAC